MRVGLGFDVHPFAPDRPLYIGGVHIPFAHGLAGHSDADVLLHAIADAIFGAIGAGDIGQHFPNTDPRWQNCPSRVFVEHAAAQAALQGFAIVNVDCTLLAEKPKIGPYVATMRATIAAMLAIDSGAVGVKATTMEKMGFVGREEGIAALAVALLAKSEDSSS
jgi:2-C-methyl-D-erythritol 2,4-cyclodiphosphate synthase